MVVAGEDGMRIRYISNSCEERKEKVVEIVKAMFECTAGQWDERTVRLIIPLHKNWDMNDKNNSGRFAC